MLLICFHVLYSPVIYEMYIHTDRVQYNISCIKAENLNSRSIALNL